MHRCDNVMFVPCLFAPLAWDGIWLRAYAADAVDQNKPPKKINNKSELSSIRGVLL